MGLRLRPGSNDLISMRNRVKTRKDAVVVLDPALSFEGRSFPPVLTAKAVVDGLMPPLGTSALPPSLEAQIPVEFRYWLAPTTEEALDVRNELVELDVIKAQDLLMVDGSLQRVVWQAFIAEEDETPRPLVKRSAPSVAGALCLQPVAEMVLIDGVADQTTWTGERVVEAMKSGGDAVCISLSDIEAHRAALAHLPSVFVLKTRPGVIFGSPLPLASTATNASVVSVTQKEHGVRFLRKADDTTVEERFVFGVVLEPDVVDSQNDTYSAEEVRKAAHRFMEAHAQLGQQHTTIVTGKLKILESYVAPVEFKVGEEVIKAGTWMLAIRVVDDGLWSMVKAGSFTGFSIGGTAIRQPDTTPTP